MTKLIKFEITPLSQGRIWSTNKQGRRFLTDEGKRFKFTIGNMVKIAFPHMASYSLEKKIRIIFYGNWYTKKKTISKTAGDLDNFNKLILDGISEALNFNDSEFFDIHTSKSKVTVSTPYIELFLGPL